MVGKLWIYQLNKTRNVKNERRGAEGAKCRSLMKRGEQVVTVPILQAPPH
jgi:hypothetical protein